MTAGSGSRRIGDYLLLSKLGEGGMGAVYKARQESLGREVALKVLPPKLARDKDFITRFFREARATARLNHPNIIAGIDVGEADGFHYFAMEYVEGKTLDERIEATGRVEEGEVLRVGAAIASALAHAHEQGIIHRDVKPDNILIASDGTPKLADLGLAKGSVGTEAGLTQSGAAVGTPHYMAPEQARGEKEIDGRTDTYGLGCTLYHAATGKTPFETDTAAVLMVKHLNEKMPHPQTHNPDLSDGFSAMLGRMVARRREDRHADLREAVEDMNAVREGKPPRSRPLPLNRSNFLPGPRRRGPRASGGVSTLGRAGRAERRASDRLAPLVGGRRGLPADGGTGRRQTTRARPFPWLPVVVAAALLMLAVLMFGGWGKADPVVKTADKPGKAKTPKPIEPNRPETDTTEDPPKPPPKKVAPPPRKPAPPKKTSVPEPPRETSEAPFVSLFNGRDLTGWKTTHGTWRVEDGVLVGGKKKGMSRIESKAVFGVHELRVEFRVDNTSNAEIQVWGYGHLFRVGSKRGIWRQIHIQARADGATATLDGQPLAAVRNEGNRKRRSGAVGFWVSSRGVFSVRNVRVRKAEGSQDF